MTRQKNRKREVMINKDLINCSIDEKERCRVLINKDYAKSFRLKKEIDKDYVEFFSLTRLVMKVAKKSK